MHPELLSNIVIKLALAILIGGVLGAEREYRSKSAGFRTLTLICLGSTIFTIFSGLIGNLGNSANPDRIASNIVTGIGFVGAGVIFKGDGSGSKVSGITTAAMIWVTAGLGMAIGAGYLLVALCATGLVLLVLFTFMLLEGWIDRVNQVRVYKIVCQFENEPLHRYEELFKCHHLKFRRSSQRKSAENMITGEWVVQGSERNHRHCIHEVLRDDTVREFEF
ncbi:MAG TPA: MgtC/SapB family protein [Puia sp.]|jgi:putative Mg2+ transporter-C (MgtC) family protein|nr:MgtC/SapB family protein [Puia sp.]